MKTNKNNSNSIIYNQCNAYIVTGVCIFEIKRSNNVINNTTTAYMILYCLLYKYLKKCFAMVWKRCTSSAAQDPSLYSIPVLHKLFTREPTSASARLLPARPRLRARRIVAARWTRAIAACHFHKVNKVLLHNSTTVPEDPRALKITIHRLGFNFPLESIANHRQTERE